jgi:hypothetical protein
MTKMSLAAGVALSACLPLLAAAQVAPKAAPKAAPQLAYRSAFADYKPYKDEPPADWRKVNDAVAPGQGGSSGHAGHSMGGMKGMAPPPSAAAPSSAATKQTDMPMRGGQHDHGGKP